MQLTLEFKKERGIGWGIRGKAIRFPGCGTVRFWLFFLEKEKKRNMTEPSRRLTERERRCWDTTEVWIRNMRNNSGFRTQGITGSWTRCSRASVAPSVKWTLPTLISWLTRDRQLYTSASTGVLCGTLLLSALIRMLCPILPYMDG